MRSIPVLLVVFFCQTGCAIQESAQVEDSHVSGLAEPAGRWAKKNLQVCFRESQWKKGFSQDEKDTLRESVAREFTEGRTGIHFTGWELCGTNEDEANVIVERASQGVDYSSAEAIVRNKLTRRLVSRGGIGASKLVEFGIEDFYYVPVTQEEQVVSEVIIAIDGYCDRTQISKELCLSGLILHELGHVAGLRHEHARPEAKQDPLCLSAKSVSFAPGEFEVMGRSANDFGTPYDSKSIMNYCYMDAYESGKIAPGKVKLSDGDVKTLQALYEVK